MPWSQPLWFPFAGPVIVPQSRVALSQNASLECFLHNLLSKTSMSKCKPLVHVLPFLKAILLQLLVALSCHNVLVEVILSHPNRSFKLWIVGNRARFFLLGTSGVSVNGNFGHIPNSLSLLSSRKKLPLCLTFTWVREDTQEGKKISVSNYLKMLVSFKNNPPLGIPLNLCLNMPSSCFCLDNAIQFALVPLLCTKSTEAVMTHVILFNSW